MAGVVMLYVQYWYAMLFKVSMPIFSGFLSILFLLAGGVTSIIALTKYKDRVILLFVSAFFGLLGLMFILGELFFPNLYIFYRRNIYKIGGECVSMFKFRLAKIEDIDSMIKVMRNTTYIKYIYPGKPVSEIKRLIKDLMKVRKYVVCIDEDNNRIVGYFILDSMRHHLTDAPIQLDSNYAYHAGVGVHSSYRSRGIATELTEYAFRLAKKSRYKGMYADVGSNNEASIKLQEKCGFKELVRYASTTRPEGVLNVVFGIRF
jgi:ribosomal protein S18 acetylase RimI-like enzyme